MASDIEPEHVLQLVFRDGKLLRKWDFTELIANCQREAPESSYRDCVGPMRTVSTEMAVWA
ncbi:hypothetical protein LWC35_38440 [Pseudonocardia kujensis]|uniref:hypothetical protein n=1 Tax=Pseudonocardia kujensis TaxID=1128675 RepID=UPI001E4FFFFB|nr:hypothetical protein [Pseudonocardia kujensis]MCE0768734.1 hypothetical protein [Pseudonocardia kujensis]